MNETQKLEYLLRLPWTFVREVSPEGDKLLRVSQIPSAVGTGDTDIELETDAWASLKASLESYIHFGDPIPLPAGVVLPWESAAQAVGPARVLVRRKLRLSYPSETAATPSTVSTSQ